MYQKLLDQKSVLQADIVAAITSAESQLADANAKYEQDTNDAANAWRKEALKKAGKKHPEDANSMRMMAAGNPINCQNLSVFDAEIVLRNIPDTPCLSFEHILFIRIMGHDKPAEVSKDAIVNAELTLTKLKSLSW